MERKTGVFLSPYGDTRPYPDHERLPPAILEESGKARAPAGSDAIIYVTGDQGFYELEYASSLRRQG